MDGNGVPQRGYLVNLHIVLAAHWHHDFAPQIDVVRRVHLREEMMDGLQVESDADVLPKSVRGAPVERGVDLVNGPIASGHGALEAVLVNVGNLRESIVADAVEERRVEGEEEGFAGRKEEKGHHKEVAPEEETAGKVDQHAAKGRTRGGNHSVVVVALQPDGGVLTHGGLKTGKWHGDEQRLEPSAVHGEIGSPGREAMAVEILGRSPLKGSQIRVAVQNVGVGVVADHVLVVPGPDTHVEGAERGGGAIDRRIVGESKMSPVVQHLGRAEPVEDGKQDGSPPRATKKTKKMNNKTHGGKEENNSPLFRSSLKEKEKKKKKK